MCFIEHELWGICGGNRVLCSKENEKCYVQNSLTGLITTGHLRTSNMLSCAVYKCTWRYGGKKESKCTGLLLCRWLHWSKLLSLVISAATTMRNRRVIFTDPDNPGSVIKIIFDNFLVSSQSLNKLIFIHGVSSFLNIFLHLIHIPVNVDIIFKCLGKHP